MSPKAPRGTVVSGVTHKEETACGKAYVTINGPAEKPIEMFLRLGSQGECTSSFMAGLGIVLSIALRWGVPAAAFYKPLMATRCQKHNEVYKDLEEIDGDFVEVDKMRPPCCISALGKLLFAEIGGEEPYVEAPAKTYGAGTHLPSGCGSLNVFVGSANGKPAVVTTEVAAPGSCAAAIVSTLSRCISIALQHGVDAEDLGKGLSGINCQRPTHKCSSCIDGIGRALLETTKEV